MQHLNFVDNGIDLVDARIVNVAELARPTLFLLVGLGLFAGVWWIDQTMLLVKIAFAIVMSNR